jgi:plasmid maintenance system antidote protein VapI
MLLNYLQSKDITLNRAARNLDITPVHLCKLISGAAEPGVDLQKKINRLIAGEDLRQAIKSKFRTQKEFAKHLSISEGYLTQIIEGDRDPAPTLALAIEDTFNGQIKAHRFLSPAKQEKILKKN